MIILLHIIIALTSLGLSTLSIIMPSRHLLQTSYGMIAMTIVSGVGLLLSSPSNVAKTCLVGLAYIIVVTSLQLIAERKLKMTTK